METLPYTILFLDGNHENFPAIYSYPVEDWQGGKVHRIRKNVLHLMRGEIFEIEGKTFFAMGGAYSIDKYMRTEGISWWKEETPTDPEFKNASKHLEEHNFKVDYILTHTLPYEILRRWGINPDAHDRELLGYLDWVMYETDFKHWYCGHWHDDADIFDKFTVLWYDVRRVE
ncbi:MAG: metallophosphoesterase [Oscillospiraceae bacterium]|nr:metallophosphoesterase [Oscillospiraceae bacterium]